MSDTILPERILCFHCLVPLKLSSEERQSRRYDCPSCHQLSSEYWVPNSDNSLAPPSTASARAGGPPKKAWLGWLVAMGALALKFGVFLFKSLKTVLSMGFMIWAYSWLFGWPFAAGFVFLIFVHEMGHVIAAKWLGLPVSAPLFIPFIGASITMKLNPRDAWTEARMAYGGPFLGAIGCWISWAIAAQWEVPWLMAVAASSFIMNLFNLIPVPPLDGGRICAAVSRWFWIPGLVLLGSSVVFFHSWNSLGIIFLILIFSIPRFKETFQNRDTPGIVEYYSTPPARRLFMAGAYILLILCLLFGYWIASRSLPQ